MDSVHSGTQRALPQSRPLAVTSIQPHGQSVPCVPVTGLGQPRGVRRTLEGDPCLSPRHPLAFLVRAQASSRVDALKSRRGYTNPRRGVILL